MKTAIWSISKSCKIVIFILQKVFAQKKRFLWVTSEWCWSFHNDLTNTNCTSDNLNKRHKKSIEVKEILGKTATTKINIEIEGGKKVS